MSSGSFFPAESFRLSSDKQKLHSALEVVGGEEKNRTMLLHPSFPASDLLNDRAAGTDPRSEHLLRLSVFMKSESYNRSEGMKDKIGGEEREMKTLVLVSSLEENKTSTQERGNERTASE